MIPQMNRSESIAEVEGFLNHCKFNAIRPNVCKKNYILQYKMMLNRLKFKHTSESMYINYFFRSVKSNLDFFLFSDDLWNISSSCEIQ